MEFPGGRSSEGSPQSSAEILDAMFGSRERWMGIMESDSSPLDSDGLNKIADTTLSRVKNIETILTHTAREGEEEKSAEIEKPGEENQADQQQLLLKRIDQNIGLLRFSIDDLKKRAEVLDSNFDNWHPHVPLLTIPSEVIQERADHVDDLLGHQRWRKNYAALAGRETETLTVRSQEIDERLGGSHWRKTDVQLLELNKETFDEKEKIITDLLGGETWKKSQAGLLIRDSETLIERAAMLTARYGDAWKKWPALMRWDPETLKRKEAQLDSLFEGYSWDRYPVLLTHDEEKLRLNCEDHTANFGSDQWKRLPTLAAVTPKTFNSSLRALQIYGITPEHNQRDVTLLMASTMETKRKKARIIREEILGHSHVHLFDKKIPLGDFLAFRSQLTAEEREQEKRELLEFSAYMAKNARLLTMSENELHKFAATQKISRL